MLSDYVDQSKGKEETNSLQLELKKLEKSKKLFVAFLSRNSQQEEDLIRVKKELHKSLKQTAYSKLLTSLTNQKSNGVQGLGRKYVNPLYHPHNKYVSVFDNLLCTHYGRKRNLKRDYESRKKGEKIFEVYNHDNNKYDRKSRLRHWGPGTHVTNCH